MGCAIKRILQLEKAIPYSKINIIDEQGQDITQSCMYSWSNDGVCWINWVNLDTYNQLVPNIESDIYLRVLLFGSFKGILLNGECISFYNISLDSTNIFLKDFCAMPNLFKPYNNLDCALLLQEQLSNSIVCMFGIPIYYIQVNPKQDSADYTFKEYALHNVESVKQIQLMMPDGQMPSSNPKLTEFDFEWETDWETELSKSQFAAAFGDTAFPKAGDIIYVPMMKRLWEVNSAYDEKNEGLMWRSTTWKLALVKYNESTNVDEGEFEGIFDNLIPNTYDEVFGQIEQNEQERKTGGAPLSAPIFAATNLFDIFMEDAIRKQYTKYDVSILEKNYNHRSLVISRNIYKFKNENGCITYQKGFCGTDGTISFIIETPGTLQGEYERDILTFGPIVIKMQYDICTKTFKILWNGMSVDLQPFTSYMICLRWNRNSFITELDVFGYKHRDDIPIYKLRPEMCWFDFEQPIASKTNGYNNDFIIEQKLLCQIHSYPLNITNIKYYNRYLDFETMVKESTKYTTQHESCIINDLARPISSGHGYDVK